nr:MAG TPA: hypothetical protein [Caudoviricetes sp.]
MNPNQYAFSSVSIESNIVSDILDSTCLFLIL